MNARRATGLLIVTSLCLACAAAAAWSQPPQNVGGFMRLKLVHSQKVLEGIAVEDFDMIAKNAQQMSLLIQDENWQIYQTPEYRYHSADLKRITDQITKDAKARNLDGAALGYVQMTMSCVNCHKYTRGIRTAVVVPPELTR